MKKINNSYFMFRSDKKNKFYIKVEKDLIEIMLLAKIHLYKSELIDKIKKEMLESEANQNDINNAFPIAIAGACSNILDTDLDYIHENFDVRQASYYCISMMITTLHLNGSLSSYEKEQPDMYKAFRELWVRCFMAVQSDRERFDHCVVMPEDGNQIFKTYKCFFE
jgi:hypothetical protein